MRDMHRHAVLLALAFLPTSVFAENAPSVECPSAPIRLDVSAIAGQFPIGSRNTFGAELAVRPDTSVASAIIGFAQTGGEAFSGFADIEQVTEAYAGGRIPLASGRIQPWIGAGIAAGNVTYRYRNPEFSELPGFPPSSEEEADFAYGGWIAGGVTVAVARLRIGIAFRETTLRSPQIGDGGIDAGGTSFVGSLGAGF